MERKFKTATGEPIKHFREIERLLAAIYCPKKNDCYTLQKAQQGWE